MSARAGTAMDALLDGLVDYAGLFPPAALHMGDAVRNFATYRGAVHRAMLARFVLPVGRLDEFLLAAEQVDVLRNGADSGPWRLAVLAAATDAAVLDAFNAQHAERFRIDTVEARAASTEEIARLATSLAPRFTVYVELPVRDDPEVLIAAVGARGLRAKIRTGGVTIDAFPAAHEVTRFLAACARRGVPFKATAGLHHPLRGEFALTYAADSARGTMYGFLNVFLAAVLLHAGHEERVVAPLIEERDATTIRVMPDAIVWRGLRADAATIRAARTAFAGSYGSCSFEEPVRDLAALDLLPALR